MSKKEEKNSKQNIKNKKQKKKKKHRVLKVFLIIVVLILLGILGFVGYSTYKNGWGIQGIVQTALGQDEKTLANLSPFTVLILGVSEDISVELTDTIIVASYNPKTQKATLLSIPRDTYVGTNKNKADSYDKINALYQTSPEKTLEAVNEITGLDIEYYVVISNDALVELVDEIGGVEFDVPIDMDYDDSSQDLYIHLEAGLQTLTGEQAEWLVRFRHNNDGTSYDSEYGDNDLGRMRTQREFLKAVLEQTLQWKNVTKLGNLIDIVKENVTTNITDWSVVKDYIPYAIEFSTENIESASLPGTTTTYNGLSFFVYSKTETAELIAELFTEQNTTGDEESEEENTTSNDTANSTTNSTTNLTTSSSSTASSENSNIKIELLNGSGDSTILTTVTTLLKKAGYNVYKTGTTTSTSKTTIVNKTGVESDVLDEIKEIIGVGNISSSISSSSTVDITIIIGKDY